MLRAIDGSQKAIIRAMGGTIDFTLKIGSTEWSKGDQGKTAGYPFSRVGEVPMIIALDTYVDWQKERVSLPKDWWVPVEEETEVSE